MASATSCNHLTLPSRSQGILREHIGKQMLEGRGCSHGWGGGSTFEVPMVAPETLPPQPGLRNAQPQTWPGAETPPRGDDAGQTARRPLMSDASTFHCRRLTLPNCINRWAHWGRWGLRWGPGHFASRTRGQATQPGCRKCFNQ